MALFLGANELAITLKLLLQGSESIRFQLTIRNLSQVKLLLPYPEIFDLYFKDVSADKNCEWYTDTLVSATWAGFTIEPDQEKVCDFLVRPCSIESPTVDDGSDYCRWCADLLSGVYEVFFRLSVDEDYFCGDSHYRHSDLLREAKVNEAVVWVGNVESNRLKFIFP
ncbi:MAG: hypothetical protein K8R36_20580 [Planctomycetales bacterium]|nr:hypothetical protein [Planctomycetales bacterium]